MLEKSIAVLTPQGLRRHRLAATPLAVLALVLFVRLADGGANRRQLWFWRNRSDGDLGITICPSGSHSGACGAMLMSG